MKLQSVIRALLTGVLILSLNGCAGMIIDTAADTTIALAKIPFKVGGAVIDLMTDDDEDE